MSAELLRRAAETLRSSAGLASEGPWQIGPDADGEITLLGPDLGDPDEHNPDDTCYVALVHPPVATALAAWLDATAEVADANDASDGFDLDAVDDTHRAAVATARAILREEETQ